MYRRPLLVRFLATLSVVAAILPCREALAVEPGVDVAVPRVTLSLVGAALAFVPANPVVEQGDFIRWRNVSTGLHTSTSGPDEALSKEMMTSTNPSLFTSPAVTK